MTRVNLADPAAVAGRPAELEHPCTCDPAAPYFKAPCDWCKADDGRTHPRPSRSPHHLCVCIEYRGEWHSMGRVLVAVVRDTIIAAIKGETRLHLELVCGPILEADRRRRARARG